MIRTLVVIPAYEEQDALPATLKELHDVAPEIDVLVVDDGSSDGTSAVARAAGAHQVRLPYNLGVGAAVRTGLRFSHDRGYDAAVVVDADGQHDPNGIADLLAPLATGADVVVGSRFAPGAEAYDVSRARRRGQRLLARLVNRLTGEQLTDVTSGFRAFSPAAIELLAREYPAEFLADTVEVLLLSHHAGLALVEVPVRMRPRTSGTPSHRPIRMTLNYLRLLIGIASFAYRRGRRRPKET